MPTREGPLLGRLRALREGRATGVLRLVKKDDHISVAYRDGLIDGVSSDMPRLQPGRRDSEASLVDGRSVARRLLDARRESMAAGDIPVSRKLLDEAPLEESARRRVIQAIVLALNEDFEEESFGGVPPMAQTPARLDLARVVLEAARQDDEPFQVDRGRPIARREGPDVSHLPWHPQELSVLGELKKPQTLHDLAVATGLPHSRVARILHVLDSLKLIDVMPAD